MDCVSLNVRGLNNPHKRKTLIQWIKNNKFQIICLQETFLVKNKIKQFEADWSGKCFHSTSNSSHCGGVSILLNEKFYFNVINTVESNDGRALLNISHHNQTYTIVNLYAPNHEAGRICFFNYIKKWILQHSKNNSSYSLW